MDKVPDNSPHAASAQPSSSWREEVVFLDGDDFFNDLLIHIDHASTDILFQTYIFRDDILGKRVSDALARAAGRGVHTRLLVDGLGGFYWILSHADKLQRQGVEIRVFHPLPFMRIQGQLVDADIVFLQEVLGHHKRHAQRIDGWPSAAQFDYIAEGLWPHVCYGKNAVYTGGHHGNAILSKYCFTDWDNINISTNRYEKRGLLHGVIEVGKLKFPLHVICIHFDLRESGRLLQINYLCDRISSTVPDDAPLIVAGDFNDWRGCAGRLLEKRLNLVEAYKLIHGSHARSFPSRMPTLRLDRIYCRGLAPVHAKCLAARPWNELSDHAALFAEFDMTGFGALRQPGVHSRRKEAK